MRAGTWRISRFVGPNAALLSEMRVSPGATFTVVAWIRLPYFELMASTTDWALLSTPVTL